MKKTMAITFVASTLFLAGCCTTLHVTKWEYKIVTAPHVAPAVMGTNPTTGNVTNVDQFLQETSRKQRDSQQKFLDSLGRNGWELIKEDDGTFYLKRPLK